MLDDNIRYNDFSEFLLDDSFVEHFINGQNFKEYVKDLKEKAPQNSEDIELATQILTLLKNRPENNSSDLKQKVWQKIIEEKKKYVKTRFISIAASFLILISAGCIIKYFLKHDTQPDIEKFAISHNPVFDQSQLILSNGQHVSISDIDSKIEYSADGENVLINDSLEINQKAKADNFNQLIIPYGKYNYLILSDGTKVWVNSGSRLIYPPLFSGNHREVYVQGEAYFEVNSDNVKPFFVKTDHFKVKVTGTKFNIQSQESENIFTTLLLEGKVSLTVTKGKSDRVKETVLFPGQLATYLGEEDISVELVEHPYNYIAWTKGYLVFHNEPLKEVLQKVARYYNLQIEFTKSLRSINISGKLDLKENHERVLKGISTLAKVNFSFIDNKYIFY